MSDNFILNASPIILLGKADLLKTISPLAKSWIIPKGVVREVEKKRSIEPYLSGLSYNSRVIQESSSTTPPLIAAWDLGQGESDAKLNALMSVLNEINFIEVEREGKAASGLSRHGDLRKLFGIWENRDISLADIRQKAWR